MGEVGFSKNFVGLYKIAPILQINLAQEVTVLTYLGGS